MECHEEALMDAIASGDMAREAAVYTNMAKTAQSLGKLPEAMEFHDQALMVAIASGDRAREAAVYANMASTLQSLGKLPETMECHDQARMAAIESGDRAREAASCTNAANTLQYFGNHEKAIDYHEDARFVAIESGDRSREAESNTNIGDTLHCLDKHRWALEYHDEALMITKDIGDRKGESVSYGNLGTTLQFLGENRKALECHTEALMITKETGDRKKEAASYRNLGTTWQCLGGNLNARDYHTKALAISKAAGDRPGEAASYGNLGAVLESLGEYSMAEECHEKAIQLSKENPQEALHVIEMARARSLAHQMAVQYFEKQILVTPKSMVGIERIMRKENNCACLYISYIKEDISFWILKASGVKFRTINVHRNFHCMGSVRNFNEIFDKFRGFSVSSQVNCEDRSLGPFYERQPKAHLSLKTVENKVAALRLVEEDDDEEETQEPESILPQIYKMIIAPVADLLDRPEIIIVPDRSLFKVPFAALQDESGRYLSETFRIRIVPSLTTLKLIQDSPPSYHSHAGALIVGDPCVGDVIYQGRLDSMRRLPCAKREAEMIGRLLSVQPLLGKYATKQAVLQRIHSVSLIHFAAHGNAERGEIALAPLDASNRIPHEQDYLLTMSDISQVQLRAKLVVLSCCHSAGGQVRVEGVVGIARAFLASGARSVLVALWAIQDEATEQFMSRFYEHLVRGKSASESLHETMKWMRGNGFTDVGQWAPFLLVGDNVKFSFVT